ncbi:sigma-70 family RNA polymerase sigma factor [Paucibacter sp. XJ19-41]|uniref:sigma-70 family RNA polymerase sigma factor n=1 Tax=Paucibacter sp. XJ19-41 TaxID=2927824 RepID=UPI00234B4D31|nr:sigma-70 family RNA polymerase sigma factor [Paucibacter sp. XJ19-41]MDC6167550.1 sigma-70 family RNA polymerase sigma factor [Paucibacter sp. XJ19-41]
MHALYSEHQAWLLGWLRRKLGCAHQAADVVQDTFLRILTSRDALGAMREPRAYLSATAQRLLVDQARRGLIEQAYLEELARAVAQHPACHASPEQTLAAVQALAQISALLERVSARAREAFLRHYLDGQTHAEIAHALGVSTRMVQKYLVQVLLQCRALDLAP